MIETKEFLFAAIPCVFAGVALAIAAVVYAERKRSGKPLKI